MKNFYGKYPVSIILCMLWSFILLPTFVLNAGGIIWTLLGLPCLFFIPGYLLLFTLFPRKKTYGGMDGVERFIISIGLSLIVVSFIGVGFNYTPWGLRVTPLLSLSILFFSIGVGIVAIYRWLRTNPDERFTVYFDFSWKKPENKVEKTLTVILAALVITAVVLFVYSITSLKSEEHFTEFYLLGPGHKAEGYPRNLSVGENATVIIGIVNHEYRTVNYTVEIWLINQSTYDETDDESAGVSQMLFVDKLTVTLEHVDVDKEKQWEPQWEYNYSFSLERKGLFKLVFLLFTSPTGDYVRGVDYRDQADQILGSAYKELHLWVDAAR